MMSNKAIEAKDKIAKIYLTLSVVFIAIFSSITGISLFLNALNF
jgi:hypothetical protein